ncbi:malonate transporter [Psychrobacter sp. Sarcosine-02u-2]|uniref:AEC family transporter n=1 Tax=Psychrobacter sp. Sarcosine-02u-2 TaxID=2058324 RepID=UPI000C7B2EC4|nr:AEC family transporter [Psychrobacter sp. Sarcosine-02u-2]PKG84431.1 malonate transporter [Psychrobacter sp. Sarcosine-02u-2]
MTAAIIFAITIVLPNLVLMGLGFFMQRHGEASQAFIDQASSFVFNYCLPCLLFFSVVDSEVDYAKQMTLIIAGIVVTFILFIGAEIYAKSFVDKPADQGVFVQGIFRSNMAIIGLATVANAYGEQGLSIGAVYMGVVTILFNILAVITLSRVSKSADDTWISRSIMIVKKLFTNPLIIALVAAFAYKALPLPPISGVIHTTGDLLAAVALPLALICAGASIDLKSMLHPSGLSMQASIGRIVIAPIIAIAVGLGFGLSGVHMGVLFLMVASPTAAASYVMAKAMGGNDILAANILAFTTVVAMFGMAIGAAILRGLGWI